jgi:hypothetical protein
VALAVGGWAVLLGLWLLLTDRPAADELLAGGAAALLAGVAGALACRSSVPPPAAGASLRAVLVLPARVGRDSLTVLWAVVLDVLRVRRIRGRFAVLPADPAITRRTAAGRRAAALLEASLAPNTVAIGVDPARKGIVVHQLVDPR